MSLESLTSKYIASAEKVLGEMVDPRGSFEVEEVEINKVVGWVRSYLEDAKYYKAQGRLENSLTSIAYCEGLLDALRLLGAVKLEWPASPVNGK